MVGRRWWWWWWRSPANPCLGRVPEQSFWFWIAVSDGGSAAELYFGKCWTPSVFRSQGICRRKEGSRRRLGWPHHTLARPGLGRTTRWCGGLPAPLCLVFWLRGSSGKIGFLQYFLGFFLKVGFLHKKWDTRAILLKIALVYVSCIQNTQIRGETKAKVFTKVDTFWTYQLPPSLAYCLSSSNSVNNWVQ
jgi:hypothetical protein